MKRMMIVISVLLFTGSVFAQEQLSLSDCINIALENNSALKLKSYSKESSEYNVTASYSGILPTVNVSGDVSNSYLSDREDFGQIPIIDPVTQEVIGFKYGKTINASDEFEDYQISARINQNLFDGFAWYNQIRKAKVDNEISKFDYLDQKNLTILTVQKDYYNLIKHKKLYEVYKVAVQRSQDQLTRTEKMYELGSRARLDVYQAKVNLGNDKISLISQKNTVEDARRQLNLTMGNDPEMVFEVNTPEMDYISLQSLDELESVAIENQPLLKSNQQQVISNDLSVSLSQANFYPKLSAYFSYARYSGFEFGKLFKDFDLNYRYSYGISLSWNLFNGFSDYANVQKSKIADKNAKETLANYNRELKSHINNLSDNYKSYDEIIKINEENLDAAKEELRLAEERYQIGAGTSLEVREAQVKLTRAEETLIAAQYNAMSTLADLDYQLGISAKKFNE